MNINLNYKVIGGILATILGFYLAWVFADILVYVLIAGVMSFIGHPIVRLFDKIHIRNFKMPHVLSAILTLIVLVAIFTTLFIIFVPVINRQAIVISSIDFQFLGAQLEKPLYEIEAMMIKYNLLENDVTLEALIASNSNPLSI
ncbi:MAG: AI-2E family transporter [Bacteroidales bacterium]